jgi:hypothetical protein
MFAKRSIVVTAKMLGLTALGGIALALIVFLNHQTSVQQRSNSATTVPAVPQVTPVVAREVLSCDVTMAKVAVPNPPLAVRLAANGDPATKIVAQLENGAFVTVKSERQNWFLIQSPAEGWIPASATDHTCNTKVEMMTFSPQGGMTTVHDRFVGSGQHVYRMNLQQGQTVTIQGKKGLLPFLLNARHQPIYASKATDEQWSTAIATTGHYLLELDSYYKGYTYDFTIRVQ